MPRSDRRPRRRLDPDARREAILAAAAAAFAQDLYPQVTITGIAQAAGSSEALLYRYFAGKEELYTAVVRLAIDELLAWQSEALRRLPDDAPVEARLRAIIAVYLARIADHPRAWALPLSRPGSEPDSAVLLRAQARDEFIQRLEAVLPPGGGASRYAIVGFFGFLDAACLDWVERGCPAADREPITSAALGALHGALGNTPVPGEAEPVVTTGT